MDLGSLIAPLPASMHAELGLWLFDPSGSVAETYGYDDAFTQLASVADRVSADRGYTQRETVDGHFVVVTYPREAACVWNPFLDALIAVDADRRRLESDLESMSASSLALLEEASMVGQVMTELSTGDTEEEVVRLGLESLLVGVAAERIAYFRHDDREATFEVVLQVVYDEVGRRASVAPYAGASVVEAGGLLARAARASSAGVLLQRDEVGAAAEPGSPESLAARELLAVPVVFGARAKLLGVLVLYDKRATSYSSVTTFGSHESKMASGLASMLAAVLGARKSAELGKELKMANAIQQQILPDRPADVRGFDLAGRCENSGAVGGDYFDFLPMNDGRTLCVVADVSGHNLASGMVMVSARSALKVLARTESDPAAILSALAASLYTDLTRTERFITAVGASIGAGRSNVEIVNAGHNDTMVYRRATGAVERLPSAETILGFMPGVQYESSQLELEPGDVVVLYTDGVTEAMDASGEMFDEGRLAEVIRLASHGSAQEILDTIYRSVGEFAEEAGGDDITAVVLKYEGVKS